MISKLLLNSYDMKDKEEYYEYIVLSYINGTYSQVKQLMKKLTTSDMIEFIAYVKNSGNIDYYIPIMIIYYGI